MIFRTLSISFAAQLAVGYLLEPPTQDPEDYWSPIYDPLDDGHPDVWLREEIEMKLAQLKSEESTDEEDSKFWRWWRKCISDYEETD